MMPATGNKSGISIKNIKLNRFRYTYTYFYKFFTSPFYLLKKALQNRRFNKRMAIKLPVSHHFFNQGRPASSPAGSSNNCILPLNRFILLKPPGKTM